MKRSLDFHRGEGVQIDKTLWGGGVWIFSLTMHLQKDIKRSPCIVHVPITHLLRSKNR